MRHLLVVAAFALPFAAAAQPDLSNVEIKPTKVSGHIYMLEGAGGNIGVSAGDDGILIVDSQFYPLAPKIKAALKGIVDKPVRFVLNTHHHGDHTTGNPQFAADGAEIVAHDNVRKRMSAQMADKQSWMSKLPVSALPVLTFRDSVTLHFNGEEIRAIHLPSGHTDGDSIIHFVKSNVVHLGDHLFVGMFPFIDLSSGGTVDGYIANLEKVLREVPKDAKIIAGHGPLATLDDVRTSVQMIKDTRAVVAAGLKKGKTVEQLKQEKVLAKWEKFAWSFMSADGFTETLARDLQQKK